MMNTDNASVSEKETTKESTNPIFTKDNIVPLARCATAIICASIAAGWSCYMAKHPAYNIAADSQNGHRHVELIAIQNQRSEEKVSS